MRRLTLLAAVRMKSVLFRVTFPRANHWLASILSRQMFVKLALFVVIMIQKSNWQQKALKDYQLFFYSYSGTIIICSVLYPEIVSPSYSIQKMTVVTPGCLVVENSFQHKLSSLFSSLVFSHNGIHRTWHLIRIIQKDLYQMDRSLCLHCSKWL